MKHENLHLGMISDGVTSESIFGQRMVEIILNTNDSISPYTFGRTNRVMAWSVIIGNKIELDSLELKELEIASLFCDIGMWAIPLEIKHKKGRLTLIEFKVVQWHPELSLKTLKELSLSEEIESNILYHHEKHDGTGYPYHINGNEIPIGAQIINAACTLYALTSERPHNVPVTLSKAVEIIQEEKNKQFHPNIVDAVQELHSIKALEAIIETQVNDPFASVKKEIQYKASAQKKHIKLTSDSRESETDNDSHQDEMMIALRQRLNKNQ